MLVRNIARDVYQFGRNNAKITIGASLVLMVVLFGYAGPLFVDVGNAEVGSILPAGQSPSAEHWLGTDALGRDMLAWLIDATPDSLRVGVMAGALGVFVGASVGFIGGYYGGWIDTILRTITDIWLAVPGLLVLIVLASMVDVLTLELMAIVIAAFAWMGAARVIRAQVLTLRERQYVEIARMSGENGIYIVFFELMPNLMPFLLAAFRRIAHRRHLGRRRTGVPRIGSHAHIDTRQHPLLAEFLQRRNTRNVVVVGFAHRHFRSPFRRTPSSLR